MGEERQPLNSRKQGKPGDPPAVPGAMQAAVVAAGLRSGAAHRAGPAGASAGRLVQHGQMGGGGVSGRSLGGRSPGLPHDGRVGVPEQQLGEVGLLEDLAALVHHGAAVRRRGRGGVNGGGGQEESTDFRFLWSAGGFIVTKGFKLVLK